MRPLLFADPIMNVQFENLVEWARKNKREVRIGALPFNGEVSWHFVVPDNTSRRSQVYSGAGRTFEKAFLDCYGEWARTREEYDD